MLAMDVKQVVPLVDVHRMSTKVHACSVVSPGGTCVGYGNKQERDRQASSSENDSDLDTKVLETEVITDESRWLQTRILDVNENEF